MGPGPLGIGPTSPTAFAPCCTAILASGTLEMQQILILVFIAIRIQGIVLQQKCSPKMEKKPLYILGNQCLSTVWHT